MNRTKECEEYKEVFGIDLNASKEKEEKDKEFRGDILCVQ